MLLFRAPRLNAKTIKEVVINMLLVAIRNGSFSLEITNQK